jgi:hypothetical protein
VPFQKGRAPICGLYSFRAQHEMLTAMQLEAFFLQTKQFVSNIIRPTLLICCVAPSSSGEQDTEFGAGPWPLSYVAARPRYKRVTIQVRHEEPSYELQFNIFEPA